MSLCGDGGDNGGGSKNGGGGGVGLACDTGGGLVAERIGCNIRELSSEILVEGGEREWGVTRNWSGPSINIVSGLRPSWLVGWLVGGCGVLAA